MVRALFVASTKQHIGKTSMCSGLVAGLKSRFKNVGYIKPVGQQHVPVESLGKTIRVDKDVRLFKEFFNLNHIDYGDMSPLIVPSGYTRSFLDGKVCTADQHAKIIKAFKNVDAASDFTVIEGTGHCGVGSIIEMDNARVAAYLGVDMVLVCNAGIGSSFDELELNRLVCEKYGVKIKGVVLNRVAPEKFEETKTYFEKALARWKIPLVGCIPYNSSLYAAAMIDFEVLFKTKMCSGERHRLRHFPKKQLMATSLSRFTNVLPMDKYKNTLWVTHQSRTDLVQALVEHVQACKARGEEWQGGLILAGSEEASATVDPTSPEASEWQQIAQALLDTETPVIRIKEDVATALAKINKYVAKLSPDDQSRTELAVQHTMPCLNFNMLLS